MRRGLLTGVAALVLVGLIALPARADDTTPPESAPASSTADPTPSDPSTPDPNAPPATPEDTAPEDTAPPTTEPPKTTPPTTTPKAPRPTRLPLRAGAQGWRVAEAQELLGWLGYEIYPGNLERERMGESTKAAVQRFQSKFGMRPTGVVGSGTWARLHEIGGKVGRLPRSCQGERTLCIDKTQRLVRLVNKGKVLATYDARFGFVGAETHEGTFRVHMKSRNHTSSLYRTWMPFALFFSGGQAVHYSPYFARDGYNGASHGCVNLRDFKGAEWLFDQVPLGTRVHVYWS